MITDGDAAALLEAGCSPEPAGLAFEPPLRWFVVSEEEVRRLSGTREVTLVSSPELLACRNLALVPFGDLVTRTATCKLDIDAVC